MTITKRISIQLGAAFALCTLIMAASAVAASSRGGDQITAAAAPSAPPSTIVAIVSPEDDGALGTIFFGEGVADRSGQHFGGPR